MSNKKKKAQRKLEMRASGHSPAHARRIKRTPTGRCLIYRRTLALFSSIVHFTVACLVAKPLNRNEAEGDLVMIQTLLLFKCKLLCYHANWILVSITTRSPSASLQIKGLATKYTTVKWPLVHQSKLEVEDT